MDPSSPFCHTVSLFKDTQPWRRKLSSFVRGGVFLLLFFVFVFLGAFQASKRVSMDLFFVFFPQGRFSNVSIVFPGLRTAIAGFRYPGKLTSTAKLPLRLPSQLCIGCKPPRARVSHWLRAAVGGRTCRHPDLAAAWYGSRQPFILQKRI